METRRLIVIPVVDPRVTGASGSLGVMYIPDVSGDVNLETPQHLTTIQEQRLLHTGGPPTSATVALDDGWSEGSGRGVAKNPRHGMVAGLAPYVQIYLLNHVVYRVLLILKPVPRALRRGRADVAFPMSEQIRWAASLATEVF
ncbi:hypothetical protein DFH09DRAFT_1084881 [Mycena vulgaris]|nr:hypothetical protein DFH09DRAFT_1084881 [Mycena vulgaris]